MLDEICRSNVRSILVIYVTVACKTCRKNEIPNNTAGACRFCAYTCRKGVDGIFWPILGATSGSMRRERSRKSRTEARCRELQRARAVADDIAQVVLSRRQMAGQAAEAEGRDQSLRSPNLTKVLQANYVAVRPSIPLILQTTLPPPSPSHVRWSNGDPPPPFLRPQFLCVLCIFFVSLSLV